MEDLDESFVTGYVNAEEYAPFAGRYVKNEYDPDLTDDDVTVDVDIAVYLKKNNKCSGLKSMCTITRTAGGPTNRCFTTRSMPGSLKPRHSRTG